NYNRVDLTNPIPEFYQGYQLLDFPDPVNLDMFITDYSNSIVYIGPLQGDQNNKGHDEFWCGRVLYPCLTIDYGYGHLVTRDARTINIKNSTQIINPITILSSLTIQKADSTSSPRATINLPDYHIPHLMGLFTVVGGNFALKDIEIKVEGKFENSYLVHYTSTDLLTLSNFEYIGDITNIDIDRSLVLLISGSIRVEDSEFSNIRKGISGKIDGLLFHINKSKGNSVYIKNTSFTNITSDTGVEEQYAIYIDTSSDDDYITFEDGLTFENVIPRKLYIESKDLRKVTKGNHNKFSDQFVEVLKEDWNDGKGIGYEGRDLLIKDKDKSEPKLLHLYIFFTQFPPNEFPVYISNKGEDKIVIGLIICVEFLILIVRASLVTRCPYPQSIVRHGYKTRPHQTSSCPLLFQSPYNGPTQTIL
ncbi:MAG: hypothetical protein EZS28_047375, partial [Streblomastix strix]